MESRRRLIVLWVTGACQLACRYCYAAERSDGRMKEPVAFSALELFKDEPLTVQFAGGEPLLNWDLIEAVTEYVEKQRPGSRLQLQTNGIAMDMQKAIYIREHRIAVGVSLDGIRTQIERAKQDKKKQKMSCIVKRRRRRGIRRDNRRMLPVY